MNQYHFIGVGGIGMSGLAKLLLSQGKKVSGSDLVDNKLTKSLKEKGALIYSHHCPSHIDQAMTVIRSSTIEDNHPEWARAKELNCPLWHRSDLLAEIIQNKTSVAVAGTHGKTTVSSLLTHIFIYAGINPTAILGGVLKGEESNARDGGDVAVLEADESDGTFLKYHPHFAIITNIDWDHMDHYKKKENLIQAFLQFSSQVKKEVLYCGDGLKLSGESYGFLEGNDWRIANFSQEGFFITFDLSYKQHLFNKIKVALTGLHGALNSAACFAMAYKFGVDEKKVREALENFPGVGKRMDIRLKKFGITVIDDYAHHPTEIETTLDALKRAFPFKRKIAVFQPHRFSRVKECKENFSSVFTSADVVVVTDIFSAGEKKVANLRPQDLVPGAIYIPRKRLAKGLTKLLQPLDVVIGLGAGDITQLADELLGVWSEEVPKKLAVSVLCGGKSSEHEISLTSAKHIASSLPEDYVTTTLVKIGKDGIWESGSKKMPLSQKMLKVLCGSQVIFPVLHGPNGEDGTMQGFLEMLNIAFVGCGTCGSAVAMDKLLVKEIARAHGIATPPFVALSREGWQKDIEAVEALGYPFYVKPSHLGSSIGVSRVNNRQEFICAYKNAFSQDTHAYAEARIAGREFEVAVLGSDLSQKTFGPGEILKGDQDYDYEAKYISKMEAVAVADVDDVTKNTLFDLAKKMFVSCRLFGMARIDFFMDDRGQVFLNEINPIPGFTPISLYPKMCHEGGVAMDQLIEELVALALYWHREKARVNL